jgi:hypothetical protein
MISAQALVEQALFSPQTIMHSLKTARPLLVSVAIFVLFAMTLFSYVSAPGLLCER